MPSEWPEEQIASFAAVKGGKRMPAGTALISNKTSHPYLRIVDFRDGGIDQSGLMYVPEAVFPQIARYVITHREVYISIVGTIGLVGQIPESLDGANLTENAAKITSIHQRVHPKFLAYFLRSQEGQHRISTKVVGSTQPKLALFRIEEIKVPVPPLVEQTQIVAVLGGLDDKIALLRETNATLEAIAQALFKSWFVDFDPVRAKRDGRDPEGMPPEVADLFPNTFEDSALGEIPKGWKAMRLDHVSEINPTRRLSKGAEAPYLEMAAVPTNGHRPEAPVGRAFTSGTKFINGDTLLARITPCLENGKTAFVDFLEGDAVGWGSTEYIVMRPKPPLPDYWAYLLCRHEPFRQFAIQAMVGTSGRQRVEVSRLAQYLVVVPDEQVAGAFAAIVEPLRARIAANDEESNTLSSLRDNLLPRLMSGKLRAPQAGVLQ